MDRSLFDREVDLSHFQENGRVVFHYFASMKRRRSTAEHPISRHLGRAILARFLSRHGVFDAFYTKMPPVDKR